MVFQTSFEVLPGFWFLYQFLEIQGQETSLGFHERARLKENRLGQPGHGSIGPQNDMTEQIRKGRPWPHNERDALVWRLPYQMWPESAKTVDSFEKYPWVRPLPIRPRGEGDEVKVFLYSLLEGFLQGPKVCQVLGIAIALSKGLETVFEPSLGLF